MHNHTQASATAAVDTGDIMILTRLANLVAEGVLSESQFRGSVESMFRRRRPTDFDSPEVQAEFERFVRSLLKYGKEHPYIAPDLLPFGFSIIESGVDAGLWWEEPSKKKDGPPIKIRVGPPLYVLGLVRDDDSSNWGHLLEWNDDDGNPHRWNLPHELLSASDSSGWRSQLGKNGWLVRGGRRGHEALTRYLTNSKPARRLTGVPRTGWHDGCFVLPDKVIPEAKAAEIRHLEIQRRFELEQKDAVTRIELRNKTLALYEQVRKQAEAEETGVAPTEAEESQGWKP